MASKFEGLKEREARAKASKQRPDFMAALSDEKELTKAEPKEKLVQKSYYITEKQYRMLKMGAALGYEQDISAILRKALDMYFDSDDRYKTILSVTE